MGNSLLLFMLIAIVCGGALIGLDRRGDRRAYAAAERHLLESEIVRTTFGDDAVVERSGGSVIAGKALNWNGYIRGAGSTAKARVGMVRQSTEEPWQAARAKFQLPGADWVDAYTSTERPEPVAQSSQADPVEERAWKFLATAAPPQRPARGNPVPVLHHPLTGHVISLVRAGRQDLALTYADSAGRVLDDDLLRTWATAVAFEESAQPLRGAEVMRDWIDRNPPSSQAWSGLARLYQKATWSPQALDATSQALTIDPDNGHALLFQGLAYFSLGDRQAALHSFTEACNREDVLGCEMQRSLAASR